MRGDEIIFEVLESEGVEFIFGNPGTTETPFLKGLGSRKNFSYIVGLQEAVPVGMAAGYALASHKPAFVNIHTFPGLANSICNMHNAMLANAPIVVTAGQQDTRHLVYNPVLSGDLTGLSSTVSKYNYEVKRVEELSTALRRAFQIAKEPPSGTTFLSFPMDILNQECESKIHGKSNINWDSTASSLEALADLLLSVSPGKIAVIADQDVAYAKAVPDLVSFADVLAPDVYETSFEGQQVFDTTHPLYCNSLPANAEGINSILSKYRILFLIGSKISLFLYSKTYPIPESLDFVHLCPYSEKLGEDFPCKLGLVGSISPSLRELTRIIKLKISKKEEDKRKKRIEKCRVERKKSFESIVAEVERKINSIPIDSRSFTWHAINGAPEETPIVIEASSDGTHIGDLIWKSGFDRVFGAPRGAGLGWAMPLACGISLANGRAPVLCFVGDGGSLYSFQSIWTAAKEKLPVVFICWNNKSYHVLKMLWSKLYNTEIDETDYVGLDLNDPEVDHCGLARSLGAKAIKIEKTSEVADVVKEAVNCSGPTWIEAEVCTMKKLKAL